MQVRIGGSADGVTIEAGGRQFPSAADFDDGNWLMTRVSVRAGAWSGEFGATLRTEEFRSFLEQVQVLYQTLHGTAEFIPLEPWLTLKLEGDKLGHVMVTGVADDEVAIGNKLSFRFEINQSYMPPLIDELQALPAEFPVVGEGSSPEVSSAPASG